MAKTTKPGRVVQGACLSRVEYGAIVEGKNVVMTFEPGDDVAGVDDEALAALVIAGAVRRLEAAAEANAESSPEAE